MKINRRYVPVLVAGGIIAAAGLALFVGVGVALAIGGPGPGTYCGIDPYYGLDYCCSGTGTQGICWGPGMDANFGCWTVEVSVSACDFNVAALTVGGDARPLCEYHLSCVPGAGAIWLADVCEPNDGFSDAGQMTWDSDHAGPLQIAAAMEGPWYEIQVNGPPWVMTEEMMESFAAMVGLDDWHNLWISSGTGTPQHVGNAIATREGRMDDICGW